MKKMVKVRGIEENMYITIPRTKAILAGLELGDEVDFSFNQNGKLEITKVEKTQKGRKE